jgi:hypothetical protein
MLAVSGKCIAYEQFIIKLHELVPLASQKDNDESASQCDSPQRSGNFYRILLPNTSGDTMPSSTKLPTIILLRIGI